MLQLKRVEQTNKFNCGTACLAMVLSTDLETAEALVGRDPASVIKDPDFGEFENMGLTALEIARILYTLGIPSLHYVPRESYQGSWVYRQWNKLNQWNLDDLDVHIRRGGTAVIGVESKNKKGAGHWIVVDKNHLLDPSPALKYVYGEVLPIQEAILLGDWCGK